MTRCATLPKFLGSVEVFFVTKSQLGQSYSSFSSEHSLILIHWRGASKKYDILTGF